MTDLEIRIAVAEAVGWKQKPADSNGIRWWVHPLHGETKPDTRSCPYAWSDVPHYESDLNAMHEAVKAAKWGWKQKQDFLNHLGRFRQRGESIYCPWSADYEQAFRLATTTAAQRAEAFLRTIGKWTEDQG